MVETAITPPAAEAGMENATDSMRKQSMLNSFRIAAVADRLAKHVSGSAKNDPMEFFKLCLSLARGIDFAVANSEVPGKVQNLPTLLKQVCQHKSDSFIEAAIMVLMISVKSACKSGWFPAEDSGELLTWATEIGRSFCTAKDLNTEAGDSLQIISTIMARFYPRLKMGQILAFLEVKPGFGAYVLDFLISKIARPSAEEKIHLFVAQIDDVETSSCIIAPPQVNILLNGNGVDGRINVSMGTGPQFPTVVSQMLKFGTNLLQAVGQFSGNYIMVVAYMSMISKPDVPALQDYVQPAVAALASDTEIIEGPSQISLNCPISFRRIKTPVKGHSCKHLQCFDFDNYMEINSRVPSWRCPHCNQCVGYVDIRVDQYMVKVLKEVGENVCDVIISADGSWKPVAESNDHIDQPRDEMMYCQQHGPLQQKASSSSNIPPDVLDLTEGDDVMDLDQLTYGTQDIKPNLANLQSQSSIGNGMTPLGMDTTSELNPIARLNPNISQQEFCLNLNPNQQVPPLEDDFWSGIFLSTYGSGTLSDSVDAQIVGGVSASNFMLSPVLTDAVSPALSREPVAYRQSALVPTSIPQSQISAPSNLPLQQPQFGTSTASNEYGRNASIVRHSVNRTPIGVQALPAHSLASVPQQSSRKSSNNTFVPQGPALASQNPEPSVADGLNPVSTSIERQHQYSRVRLNPHQVPQMTSSPSVQHQMPHNLNRQDRSFISSQAAQQIASLPPLSQTRSAYRTTSVSVTEHQNSRQQQPWNVRSPHGMSPSPSLIRPSSQPSPHLQRVAQSGMAHMARKPPTVPVPMQKKRPSSPSLPVPMQKKRPSSPSLPINAGGFRSSVGGDQRGNTGGTLQPATSDLPAEQNWRPTGRMRGSLSGKAYSDALNEFIIQPTQLVRPPLTMTPPPPIFPGPQLMLVANNRNANASQPVSYAPTEPTSVAGSSGILPEPSSGMQ